MGDVNKKRAIDKSNYIYERKKRLDSIKKLHEINPRNAKKELIRHLEIYPNDMYAKFYFGKLCEEESLFEEALTYYNEVALSDSPNFVAGIYGLAEVNRKKGNYKLAKELYYKTIKESTKEQKSAIFNLARMERIDGNYERAIELLESLSIQDSNVSIEKVKILGEQKRYKEALILAKKIIPENYDQERIINYNIAKMYAINKEYENASIYFSKAKLNAPHDLIYYKTLSEEGKMFFDMEQYEKAISNFTEIQRNGEELCGEVNFILGKSYQEIGKYKEAMEKYYDATITNGVNDSMKGMNLLYLAKLELIAGFYNKALNHFKESLDINKVTASDTVPFIANSIIYIDIELLKYEEAINYINTYINFPGVTKEQMDLYKLIIRKRNDLLDDEKFYGYRERQIANYSKKDAINHIKNHHGINSTNSFSKNIDIEKLYNEIRSKINDDNITQSEGFERHIIEYKNAGKIDGKIINQINVVVIPGTKNILTMFPNETKLVTRHEILKTFGNENKHENENIKKFNARFSKFNNIRK